MRLTDFCHPTLCINEHPYSPAPGSSSGLAPCVYQADCVRWDRGIERFHDARIASRVVGDAGEYWSHSAISHSRPGDLERPTLTPLSPPSRMRASRFLAETA